MKTLAITTRFSTSAFGITPSATESATALATAFWAGPNMAAACSMFLTVTFGTIRVAGFGGRFGLITERSGVCPAESWARPLAKAVPTGPSLSPISRST